MSIIKLNSKATGLRKSLNVKKRSSSHYDGLWIFVALTVFFICRLPEGFTQLRNLTHLGLNDISLMRLPPDIGRYGSEFI